MLTTLQQWLGEQIVPLVFIGFAVLMGFALLYFSAQSRRSALTRDRSGRTEETFVEFLAPYGFDPEIARATYRYLQERQQVAFPILPTDDLDRDLGLNEDEVRIPCATCSQRWGVSICPDCWTRRWSPWWTWCATSRHRPAASPSPAAAPHSQPFAARMALVSAGTISNRSPATP